MSTNTVRVLPSPTWNWLKVNDITIENIETIGSLNAVKFDKDNATRKFSFVHEESARDCIEIQMEKGAKGLCIIDHKSAGKGVVAGLTVNYGLEPESELTIVEVVRMDDADSLLSGFVGAQGSGSKLNIIQLFIGGKNVYCNIINDLVGNKSEFDLKSAYSLKAGNLLDINYVINHIGKDTVCNLDTKGVLYGGANKTYRGTIDFKQGCKGAKGNEIEDVLLMDDEVINKTVPVILCAEEDVEGNHGATIGRVSNDIMFYMMSRGLKEEEIVKMIADARIEQIVSVIPDEDLKGELNGDN